jgi:hypothetical protein
MNKYKMRPLLILLIAFICLTHSLKAVSQTKEEFDNLIFYIPAGFTVNKTDNSMLFSDPTAGNGQYFTVTVNKSTFSLKKIEKSFPVFWRESLLNEGVDNPAAEPAFVKAQTNSGWNCFRGGKLVQYNAQTPSFYYHLTVMRYVGVTLRIITRASSEELFMQKIPLLMQLVSSVNFKKQPPPQNTKPPVSSNPTYPAPQTGSGNPSYNQPVQLNGLYISVQGDLLYNAELSVLYFSPDRTVFTDIPEKGFFNLNMQEHRAQYPSLSGSFTTMNNTISVKMNNQANAATYTIDPDGTIRATTNPALLFKKFESLDNYQFEGVYINRQGGNAASIVFNKDGSFTDNGLIKTILSKGNEAFSNGNGSYSSRQNSLLLQYTDGRQLQLCFYMMPEDFRKGGKPDKILINNYLLVKQ